MKKKIFENYALFFIIFLIGSFFGFVYENILNMFLGNYHIKQGLIYEPLIPIYGIGLLFFYLVYHSINLKKYNKIIEILIVLSIGFFIGGITEYLCSYIQEKVFGTISWDYSNLKFDLNGRTSLVHAFFWAILGVLFYEFVLPLFIKIKRKLSKQSLKILVIVLSIIFIFDVFISTIACLRREKRKQGIEASNYIEQVLDKYYPDQYIDYIYNNARIPK